MVRRRCTHESNTGVVTQAISIMDNYAYRALVRGIYFERIEAGRCGQLPNEARLKADLRRAAICLSALDALAPGMSVAGCELPHACRLARSSHDASVHANTGRRGALGPVPRLRTWFANAAPAEIGAPTIIC